MVKNKNPEQVQLIVNSEEGCHECVADASIGWMSVDDMSLIGSRACGDSCTCEIEFLSDKGSMALDIKVTIKLD